MTISNGHNGHLFIVQGLLLPPNKWRCSITASTTFVWVLSLTPYLGKASQLSWSSSRKQTNQFCRTQIHMSMSKIIEATNILLGKIYAPIPWYSQLDLSSVYYWLIIDIGVIINIVENTKTNWFHGLNKHSMYTLWYSRRWWGWGPSPFPASVSSFPPWCQLSVLLWQCCVLPCHLTVKQPCQLWKESSPLHSSTPSVFFWYPHNSETSSKMLNPNWYRWPAMYVNLLLLVWVWKWEVNWELLCINVNMQHRNAINLPFTDCVTVTGPCWLWKLNIRNNKSLAFIICPNIYTLLKVTSWNVP